MADLTPAPLTYSGGALLTSLLVPARLTYSATLSMPTGNGSALSSVAVPDLDNWTRYDRPQSIAESEWVRWMARDQKKNLAIEEAFAAQQQQIVDLTAIVNRLTAAEQLAAAANDKAQVATETAAQASQAVQETFTTIDPTFGQYYSDLLVQ